MVAYKAEFILKRKRFFYRFAMSCSVFIQTPTPLLAMKRSYGAFSDEQ